MLYLRTFGGLAVSVDDAPGTGAAQQRKTLALLALLAAAGRSGLSRDKLLAYLWPDADEERARGLLKQACYALRRDLHAPELFLGTSQLRLNPDLIRSDVQAFEASLERGDLMAAAQIYAGSFLDGFYLSEADEFERWVEAVRGRLRERATAMLEQLANQAGAAADHQAAASWWRRLAAHDPLNTRVVLGLMQALAATGDRAGALQVARDHDALLREELDAAPDPTLRDLAERLKTEMPPWAGRDIASAPAIGPIEDVALPGRPRTHSADVAAAPRRSPSPWRRRSVAITLVALCLAAGWWLLLGAPFAARVARTAHAPKRIVVLPFTNLGPADEQYFADGVTDEITARLAAIGDMRIIGSASASRYRGTDETTPEIGRELGVGYVLKGSVRWEKPPHGPARVRVTPELVSTTDGANLWAEVYDEPLDEIFRVQSDIAQKVVRALDVALLDPPPGTSETVPTHNLEAYDYYLRGNDYTRRGTDERLERATVLMYEKAVELDSGFALAYAMLSRVHSRMYLLYYDRSPARLALAKQAVDRALALQPDLPEAHHSLGTYYWVGLADYDRALREFAIAEASRPNESNVFLARAVLRQRQGKFPESLADFGRAGELDPGSATLSSAYGEACAVTGNFARAESLFDRAIALSPDWTRPYLHKADLYLRMDGDVGRARAVLDEAQREGLGDTPDAVFGGVRVALVERKYDEAIARLSSGAPAVFADQQRFVPRAELYAQVYGLMGRPDLASSYYDSARALVAKALRDRPDDARLHSALGLAYAGLGFKQNAIREGRRAVELLPISRDTYQGYPREWDLARIYVMVGQYDAAVERLTFLVSIPGFLTPAWLRIDPVWDPLRRDPRFQRLASEGS